DYYCQVWDTNRDQHLFF
nr:immunoglobulin light chain junction region [Macaca mulatta]